MMKRAVKIILVLCAVVSVAFARGNRETIAFYLTGITLDDAIYTPLSGFMTMAIVNGGKYIAVDRTAAVLDLIAKEHIYQRSGAVDDAQIVALGKQWGVKYVIAVESSRSLDGYFLSAKMVDVEGAFIIAMGVATSDLENYNDLKTAIDRIVGLLGLKDETPLPGSR